MEDYFELQSDGQGPTKISMRGELVLNRGQKFEENLFRWNGSIAISPTENYEITWVGTSPLVVSTATEE